MLVAQVSVLPALMDISLIPPIKRALHHVKTLIALSVVMELIKTSALNVRLAITWPVVLVLPVMLVNPPLLEQLLQVTVKLALILVVPHAVELVLSHALHVPPTTIWTTRVVLLVPMDIGHLRIQDLAHNVTMDAAPVPQLALVIALAAKLDMS